MRPDPLPAKIRRLLVGLSQREIAHRIGCSQGWVSQIERGLVAHENRYAVAYVKLLRDAEKRHGNAAR